MNLEEPPEDHPARRQLIPELGPMLTEFDETRPRSMQKTIGPSEIGSPCLRQLVYKLSDAPEGARDVPWAPLCGSGVHEYPMAAMLRWDNERCINRGEHPRWIIEHRVWPSEHEHGSGDAYDTWNREVVDWKFVGSTQLHELKMARPKPVYRVQTHLYGLGYERAGWPVDSVRLVGLARSADFWHSQEWAEPFKRYIALDALQRLERAKKIAGDIGMWRDSADDVEAAPSEDNCAWCRYFQCPDRYREEPKSTLFGGKK